MNECDAPESNSIVKGLPSMMPSPRIRFSDYDASIPLIAKTRPDAIGLVAFTALAVASGFVDPLQSMARCPSFLHL